MLSQKTAAAVLDAALRSGGDFAEIFLEDRRNNVLTMRSSRIENVNSNRLHGAGVRVYSGLSSVYVYTNDTSLEGLLDCAARAAAAISGPDMHKAAAFAQTQCPNVHIIKELPSQANIRKKAEKIRAAGAILKMYPEVVQGIINYTDSEQRVWIANSEGLFKNDLRVYTRFTVNAVASNGTENQTGSCNPGAMQGFELFDRTVDPEMCAHEAARTAVRMLHAPLCPSGMMPVVIDNGFGGVIFHEACGHSLEATSVAPGNSEFSGKLGQKIASDRVTAIDDGTIPNAWGSENIDDEGNEPTKLVLIENGILKNYMIDRLNSRKMGMPVTGSGRRQGYMFAPTSRMRNTMGGGSVDPSTGKFNFAVQAGYLVKDGRIIHPVRGASLIGRGSEILMKIDRVGRDMQMAQGMCGSLSGSVPTNVGQPMIRVSSLTVGGAK